MRIAIALVALCLIGCPADAVVPTFPAPTGPGDDTVPAVVKEVNAYRAKKGLPALTHDPALTKAAKRHANDMATRAGLNHTGSDGSSFSQRAREAGFAMRGGGEIIAGSGDPAEAVSMWSRSSGHNAQMLTREFKYIGGAVAGEYGCVVFGNK